MALFTACLKPDPVVVEPKLPVETSEAEAQADIETPLAVSVAREQGTGPHRSHARQVATPPHTIFHTILHKQSYTETAKGTSSAKHSRWGSGLFSSARMGTKQQQQVEEPATTEAAQEQPTTEDATSAPSTARHSRKGSKHSRTDSDKHLRRGSGIFGSGFFLTRRLSRFGSGALPPTDGETGSPKPQDETSGVPPLRNIHDCIDADQANMALVTYNPNASTEYRYTARGAPTRLLETMSPKLMQAVQQVPLLRNIAYRVEEIPSGPLGHRASMRAAALRRAAEHKGYLAPTAAQLQRQRAMVEEGKVPPSGSVTARSGYNTTRNGYPTYRSNLGNVTGRGGNVTARGEKVMHDVPFHEAHKLMTSRTITVEGKPMWR